MSDLLISVIVPLYNKAEYIERAVLSVLAQTYQAFELIVIDDGSTDGAATLVEQFLSDRRVRLIRQENKGEGAARNRGLEEMRGELAAFLDADDEWLSAHLEDLVGLVNRYPSAALYSTGFIRKAPGSSATPGPFQSDEDVLIADYFAAALRWPHFVNSSSTALRRDVVASVGGFVENLPIGTDQEYWARVALTGPVAVCGRRTSIYHTSLPGSAMSNSHWRNRLPEAVRTLQTHLATCRDRARHTNIKAYIAWVCTNHAASGIAHGHASDCRQLLRSDLVRDPYVRWRVIGLRIASEVPVWLLRSYLKVRSLQASLLESGVKL